MGPAGNQGQDHADLLPRVMKYIVILMSDLKVYGFLCPTVMATQEVS